MEKHINTNRCLLTVIWPARVELSIERQIAVSHYAKNLYNDHLQYERSCSGNVRIRRSDFQEQFVLQQNMLTIW